MACELLEYYVMEKNTFLEACLPEDATQTRRKSWSCGDSGCEVTLSLPLRPGRIDPGSPGTSKPDMDEADEATTLEQHANGTCKPCVFFASVGCSRSQCRFCHLAHNPPSTKRPRKHIREGFKAAVTKVFKEVQEPDALHAALQDLAIQDRYVRLLIIGQIESMCSERSCSSFSVHT